MSTRLSKALEFANYRVTLNNQNAALKAKTQNLLSYSINGGTFVIDLPLLTFCKQLIDLEKKDAVLLDSFGNPIKVELKTFHKEILSKSYNLDKTPVLEGTLLGIKAQYLILDHTVINLRKYTGYEVALNVL